MENTQAVYNRRVAERGDSIRYLDDSGINALLRRIERLWGSVGADTEEARHTGGARREGARGGRESCRSRPIGWTDNTTGNWSIKTQKCRRACDKIKSWNLGRN